MVGEVISGKDCVVGRTRSVQDSRKSRSRERRNSSRICDRSFRRDVTPFAYMIDGGVISDNEPVDGNRNSSSLQNSLTSHSRESNLNRPLRRKPSLYWDVPPPGFENVTPLQYRETRQIPANIVHDAPQAAVPAAGSEIARRLYNRNLHFGVSEEEIVKFFNQQNYLSGLAQAEGNPVLARRKHFEENVAFSEFRSRNETTQGMSFDGINIMGQNVNIQGPHDYQPIPVTDSSALNSNIDVISTVVNDSPHTIFIGGIPNYLKDGQVKKILLSFGPLRAFNLVRDADTGLSKGHAFAEYMDLNVTDQAIAGLNGMQLGDKKLIAQRARVGAKNTTVEAIQIQVPGIAVVGNSGSSTEVQCILDIELLEDEQEHEYIFEDYILILIIIIEILWLVYMLYYK